ncbi:MAG: 3-hydroxyacyl-ACP dehydratase FabZ [Candidatus Dadabacteria bacterium]|nr:3-hydroxyacyl-ACP dehydratase FabZ [Candidatus Dadabacteria bacterium]
MVFDKEQIKEFIPHREPFLFLDSVAGMERGVSISALKTFSPDEFFFQGHFPGNPIVPGVVITEALAQAGGVLIGASFAEEIKEQGFSNAYLMGLDSCRFRKPVPPGEQLTLSVSLERKRGRIMVFAGRATADGLKVADASITASFV